MSKINVSLLSSVVTALVIITAMHAKSELDLYKQRLALSQQCIKAMANTR